MQGASIKRAAEDHAAVLNARATLRLKRSPPPKWAPPDGGSDTGTALQLGVHGLNLLFRLQPISHLVTWLESPLLCPIVGCFRDSSFKVINVTLGDRLVCAGGFQRGNNILVIVGSRFHHRHLV